MGSGGGGSVWRARVGALACVVGCAGPGAPRGDAYAPPDAATDGDEDDDRTPGGTRGTGSSGNGSVDDDDDSGTDASGSSGRPDVPAPVEPVATVAELLTPFDQFDDGHHPGAFFAGRGKTPEIVVRAEGDGMLVFAQDYTRGFYGGAVLLRLRPLDGDYVVTAFTRPPLLDSIMGMDHDGAGRVFVASGVDENPGTTDPEPGVYRTGIVSVVATDLDGVVDLELDLDIARGETGTTPDLIIDPMTSSSARLRYGGGQLALVHGNTTDRDAGGVRHQRALGTVLDATTGAVLLTRTKYASHSFDQRLMWDGEQFVETHLGDAIPRAIGAGPIDGEPSTVPLFHIKGPSGYNITRSELGNIATIEADPLYGYLALFVAENSASETAVDPEFPYIAASRELGIVRIDADFPPSAVSGSTAHLDPALPDTLDVSVSGAPRTNRLRWLTDYAAEGSGAVCADRPKLVGIGGDRYVVLWERWERAHPDYLFDGTWAMLIDDHGSSVEPPTRVSDAHLPRGDDAFALEGGAAWITGDAAARSLQVHVVSSTLVYRMVTVE